MAQAILIGLTKPLLRNEFKTLIAGADVPLYSSSLLENKANKYADGSLLFHAEALQAFLILDFPISCDCRSSRNAEGLLLHASQSKKVLIASTFTFHKSVDPIVSV
jgi:hypothetical protein